MPSCLLLVDLPQPGAWNMAVDEALLAAADERSEAAVRFYRWSEPTLSLGYFQRAADRALHPASVELPLVRRQSGGGALVHDRELTYSIVLPAAHPVARRPPDLYRIVHAALIAALARQGAKAHAHACGELGCGDATACANGEQAEWLDDPFLCFLRRHPIDLVAAMQESGEPSKIVGSAQRRRHGALLQHGSLLLSRSPAAPELLGLREAAGVEVDLSRLIEDCVGTLAEDLQLQLTPGALPAEMHVAAETLAASRYGSAAWTLRR